MSVENLTNVAVQLTASQIQDAVQEKVIGLCLSLFVTAFGGFLGKFSDGIVQMVGLIIGVLGLIGAFTFISLIVGSI